MDSSLSGRMMADRVNADFARELELENAKLRNGLTRVRAAGIRSTGFDAGEAIILARWVDRGCVDDIPEAPPWVDEWIMHEKIKRGPLTEKEIMMMKGSPVPFSGSA